MTTGFIMLVYDDDQPVTLHNGTDRNVLLPVFSTVEKLEQAETWMHVRDMTRPMRITDQAEFLASIEEAGGITVAADPFQTDRGTTRFTAIQLAERG
jgi:hypothetical protein